MKKLIQFIPNLFTLGNLFCGCLAVLSIFQENYLWTVIFVLSGAFLDFFDGFLARLLKVSGPLGKELDSLADMVTFGVVPGLIVFHFLAIELPESYEYLKYTGFLITLASAYRLANFNIATNQTDEFIGVPVPANTLFFLSFCLFEGQTDTISSFLFLPQTMIACSLVFSYLLNAKFPLIALKFKSFGWKGNEFKWALILMAVALGVILQAKSLPFIILGYVLLSVIKNGVQKKA